MSDNERELVVALAWMFLQYGPDQPDHMNASEDAQTLLSKYGLLADNGWTVDELKLDEYERQLIV